VNRSRRGIWRVATVWVRIWDRPPFLFIIHIRNSRAQISFVDFNTWLYWNTLSGSCCDKNVHYKGEGNRFLQGYQPIIDVNVHHGQRLVCNFARPVMNGLKGYQWNTRWRDNITIAYQIFALQQTNHCTNLLLWSETLMVHWFHH
jgi:hypothetical protein